MSIINKDTIEATRYFLKLVELGSYSSVKKYYNVELNTIKNKIDGLERFLDIKLITNIQNRISPTANGMKYYHSCNKTFKDLEDIIQNVKQSGFRERKSIKILGSPLFLKIVIDLVLPRIQEINDESFNFALDSYQVDNLNGSQYQFDSYSVIQIFTKHIEFLDLDDWIVCSSVEAIKLPAYIYGNKDFIKEMHNNPEKIIEAPIVFNRYDFSLGITDFKYKSENYKFNLDNVRYTVDNEIQKANILKSENVIGFMPKFYHNAVLKDYENIAKIEGVEIEFPLEPHLVLVYKHSRYKKELINIVRSGIEKIKKKYVTA
ncbi:MULTISPECIES: LysR family transcriptional regulator [unclassified Francisella]|uniref:LysR family transcriptional regulator n=1 Tax=unclassified Francisella TaxID=2610885 RepID=UPI002E37486A|nr:MULTISPECIES: LysR family transcriptional regulator [unclassified Francisella]MED7819985.1 LysR family transcriptional regulator [Francisella sp. 19S2-4]MED7830793.1 LysR family transcriptional regulator [Francisella sp. 19S2-10]